MLVAFARINANVYDSCNWITRQPFCWKYCIIFQWDYSSLILVHYLVRRFTTSSMCEYDIYCKRVPVGDSG